jgi:hypothetical protein
MMWILWLSLPVASAAEPAWALLSTHDGWEKVAHRDTDVGSVDVLYRRIGDTHCLQGVVATPLTPPQILAVAEDIDGTMKWSKAGLAASKLLKRTADGIEFYQWLDIPDWTLVTDRYWVLRGKEEALANGVMRFRWTRIDAATAYPDLYRNLSGNGTAIEVPVNWGEWSLAPSEGATEVSYRVCTDVGGALPEWLQKVVAQRTLPDTVADVLREAKARASR